MTQRTNHDAQQCSLVRSKLIDLDRDPDADAIVATIVELDGAVFLYATESDRIACSKGFYAGAHDERYAYLYWDRGRPVGFNFITVDRLVVEGRARFVVGSTAGFLPGYTGANRTQHDATIAVLQWKLKHPRRDYYLVPFVLTPYVYNMFARLAPGIYPSPTRLDPTCLEHKILAAVLRHRGSENLSSNPEYFVTSYKCVLRHPPSKRTLTDAARFFSDANPGFERGDLLGFCIPLTASNLVAGYARYLWHRWRRASGSARHAAAARPSSATPAPRAAAPRVESEY